MPIVVEKTGYTCASRYFNKELSVTSSTANSWESASLQTTKHTVTRGTSHTYSHEYQNYCVFSLATAGIWLYCSPGCFPRCCYSQHFPCASYGVSSVKTYFLRRLLPNFCHLAELDLAFYSVKTLSDIPSRKKKTCS